MITPQESSNFILSKLDNVSVIPVLVVDEVDVAIDIAKVLVDNNMPILEVTLRTENALKVMEKMATVDGAIVAAGTVLNQQQILDSKNAGAQFLVAPGHTKKLIQDSADADMPLLPGAATASEIMSLTEQGFGFLKFFPAEINGGVPALKSFASPLPQAKFCPTGGVNENNLQNYLSLTNVVVAGGSWIVTADDIKNRDWDSIARKAKAI